MTPVIPFFQQPTLELGVVTIAAFGVIVALSVVTGMWLGARRFGALQLDRVFGERFAWWVVIGGFAGAHLFAVIFYFPREIVDDPLILLRVWDHISSFGGIVGGAIAIAIFLARSGTGLDASTRWAYIDTAAYVFPISLMIGRFACALAHDHPGTITDFPLAISLATPDAQGYIAEVYSLAGRGAELPSSDVLARLGFHDLGWYEFLFLALVVVPIVLLRERHEHRTGVHHAGRTLVVFIGCYMPVRFALDFLRVSDVRYGGFTPAQWAALVALASVPVLVRYTRRVPTRPFVPE